MPSSVLTIGLPLVTAVRFKVHFFFLWSSSLLRSRSKSSSAKWREQRRRFSRGVVLFANPSAWIHFLLVSGNFLALGIQCHERLMG